MKKLLSRTCYNPYWTPTPMAANIRKKNFSLFRRISTLISFLAFSAPLFAASLPSGFRETRVASELDPVDLQFAPDGRVFLTEKNGRIRIIKNDNLLSRPFMSLSVDNFNERGVMGLAFDPNFLSNQFIYVYYTVRDANHNRVSRFKANGDVVQAGSETVLIDIDPSNAGNHNGGSLLFKDGKLFITTGDGAIGAHSQQLNTLLGKVLRINPDGSIPSDNPFFNQTTGKYRAIWALGLRNPFKATLQPGTGKIYVNDVGGNLFEEINEILPGKNYGWPGIEGPRTGQNPPANYQDPVYAYPKSQGCSITGGTFYNPADRQFPNSYQGRYFYADYCRGYIKILDVSTEVTENFATGINRPIDIKVSPNGTLYYIARGGQGGGSQSDNTASNNGAVWKVEYTGSGLPSISSNPVNQTVPVGSSATFTVSGSGSGTLQYQWQRNGSNIAGAKSASYTLSPTSMNDNGASFRCVVLNQNGSATSNNATLTVTLNQAPVATITSPVATWLYRGGEVINFGGNGTDPEQGDLSPETFTWRIDFHHADHVHPAMQNGSGIKNGTFQIPSSGESDANVWYRIFLTVRDNEGLQHTTFRDVHPVRSRVTLTTVPAGLQVILDGSVVTTPYTFTGVAGITRTIAAVTPQALDSRAYQFVNWSDNGAVTHPITTPATNTTLTAVFQQIQTQVHTDEGLNYAYYEGEWTQLPDFTTLTPRKTGQVRNFDLGPKLRDSNFGFAFTGYLTVATAGNYTFYTASDDGSRLYLNGRQIVDNDGLHGLTERSGSLYLPQGTHSIRVTFFERTGAEMLQVNYQGPGIAKQPIPSAVLSPDNQASELSGSYTLMARHSGKALTVANNAGSNGASVQQNSVQGTGSQVWIIAPAGGGYYTLTSQLSGKLLSISGGSTADGANAQQWADTGGDHQKWLLEPVGDDYYVLKAKHSGKALDVASSGTAEGTLVRQWRPNGTQAQMWKLVKVGFAGSSNKASLDDRAVEVYPNPASNQLTVSYVAAALGEAQLMILDGTGKQRAAQGYALHAGNNTLTMDVRTLEPGLYLIKIVEREKAVTKKVLISR